MIDETSIMLTQRRRRLLGSGKTGTRPRGDNGVSPPPRSVLAVAVAQRARSVRPAALEWQGARLPLLGRLWARAWVPSALLAGSLVALMYLLQASGVAATGYDNQRLQIERDDWQLRNEQLRLELAKRRSLTWIESEATGRLGMVRAEPTALTYLKVAR
jgi:hypothetical protein